MANDVHFTGRLDKNGEKELLAWPRTLRICKRVHGRSVRMSFTNRTNDPRNDVLKLKLETTLKGRPATLQDIADSLPSAFDPGVDDQTLEIVSGTSQEFTVRQNGMFLAEDCRFNNLSGDTSCGIHFLHPGWKDADGAQAHADVHVEC